MSEVFTYSPSDVSLLLSDYRVTGFESIKVSRNSPPFSMIKGIRGQNTRVRNKDTSCTITVELLQTAIANDVLSELINLDLQNNAMRISLSLTDGNGNAKIQSENAYIETFPEASFSNDIETRRWTIACLDTYEFNVGGNANFKDASSGGGLFDIL